MYVDTYREYGISPRSVRTLSAAELLRSDKKAHFVSFQVDLVGVVSNHEDGKYHIDMQASGKDNDYFVLCMSSNNAGRFVLESIKRIILMNNEISGSTTLSTYVSKEQRGKVLHNLNAPVLYANMDMGNGAELHYKLSGTEYFDHLAGKVRDITSLNIYYLSPFYYKSIIGKSEQITTNIVLSGMEIGKMQAKEGINNIVRNYQAYRSKYRQTNIEEF
ncbi:MAG: hypothetical protein QW814_01075 [Methanothrix sp.]